MAARVTPQRGCRWQQQEPLSAHSRDQVARTEKVPAMGVSGERPPSTFSAQDRKLSNSSVTLGVNDRLAK